MNTSPITKFVHIIENSSLLSDVQKREFLEKPEIFPESYREQVIEILTRFESRNRERYRNVEAATEEKVQAFERDLNDADITDEERQDRLNAFRSALPQSFMTSDA